MKPFTVGTSNLPDAPWMNVYPNPTEGMITINFSLCNASLRVTVRNIYGKVVSALVFYKSNSINFDIPGDPGLYILEINPDNKLPVNCKILKN